MRLVLVTPSWAPDLERCRVLVESVRRFVPDDVAHYVLVSRQDRARFAPLAGGRTRLLLQDDVVDGRFFRVPFSKKWRVTWGAPPVRGWIYQQLVKLSLARALDADVFVVIDSDCFYVRPFDPRSLVRDGKVPLFREDKRWFAEHAETQRWHEVGRQLLRLPPRAAPWSTGYVGQHIYWRRDVLLKLHEHLRDGGDAKRWIRGVARQLTFSEYVLYGMFAEHVLGVAAAGHYALDRAISVDYWDETPLAKGDLLALRDEVPADKALVMINAKSETPVPLIREVFVSGGAPAGAG